VPPLRILLNWDCSPTSLPRCFPVEALP